MRDEAWRRRFAMDEFFARAKPTRGHLALASLYRAGKTPGLITQNIDNLHERAGNKNIIHMHGELLKVRCAWSGQVLDWKEDVLPEDKCHCCQFPARLRPHVVWFGEMLPQEPWERAYEALERHGSEELKKLYLPKLTDGTWSGTMCLTEPQCGTDLGLIRTKAEPRSDGSYDITGTKIFISAGEHDLTENILHLVLARLPDAPGGTKGISLFLVPKFIPKADGSVGERNGIRCGALEHKMGIKANATCVMNMDGAKGWLVGETNKGMNAMFVMMNAARLGVGMQGLGIAECSYQSAVAYARDRLQMRSLTGPKNANGPADPIIVHPDVRRMLLTQKSFTEAARALALWVGMLIDESHRHPDAEKREAADDLIQMLTPIIKAYFTDMGSECANLAVQTYGGHGFIRENGVEQLVRDARITQLYEGTNGIQARDLVGRKVGVPGFNGIVDVLTRKWIRSSGGDASKVTYIELQFPGMGDALKNGLVDAVALLDPFYSRIADSKIGYAIGNYSTVVPAGTMPTGYAATRERVEKNPALVRAYRAALDDAVVFINNPANVARVKASMAKHTKLPPQIADTLPIPNNLTNRPTAASIRFWVELMKEQSLIRGNPDASRLIAP